MNKTVIAIIGICGFFIALYFTARFTNVLGMYYISSYTNAPTLKIGQVITVSRLKQPDTNTFVGVKTKSGKGIFIYRCVAKGNDLVEIRDGILYLNGKKRIEPYTWNQYFITRKQMTGIRRYLDANHFPIYDINDSLSAVTMSAADLNKCHLDLKPWILEKSYVDSGMYPQFVNLKYNRDNFGPIRVPQNSYFVLGDNRHDAYDSRYLGFIPDDRMVFTVIYP